jgi:hypothetical protein
MRKSFITLALAIALSGCGGGIDTIPIPALNVDDMLANWTNNNSSCIQLIYALYDNADCSSTSVGSITDTYDADWSAPTSTLTKHNAARVKLNPPARSTEGQVPVPTLTIDTSNSFVLFYAENNQLYLYSGGMPNELDADGFPLGITTPSAIFSK